MRSLPLIGLLVACAAASAPPRGWNSWNSYGQWVNETQLLAQADFFVRHDMVRLGWEYVISDGGWYYPNAFGQDSNQTLIDEWGRLLPTPDRYPSGWKRICDDLHQKGLKCGFHLFRGIPGHAWEEESPIFNSPQNYTARDAGFNGRPGEAVVKPHGAFYDINMNHPAATQYLEAMFKLYCSWGIDFIKLDGVGSGRSNETSYLAIQAYRAAIDKYCKQPVVLSLSAGGPGIPGWPDKTHDNVTPEYVHRVQSQVQMVRVTPDTWDIWDDNDTACPLAPKWAKMKAVTTTGLYANITGHSSCCWGGRIVKHFEEFAAFAHIADDYDVFPDGDMLQIGRVGTYPNLTASALRIYDDSEPTWEPNNCTIFQLTGTIAQAGAAGGGYDPQICPRMSYLNLDEQRTLVTLWSIARSPLIMGGDLLQSPKETIALLTNQDILEMNSHAKHARQLYYHRQQGVVVWKSVATGLGKLGNGTYVAIFNVASKTQTVTVGFNSVFVKDVPRVCNVRDLWSNALSKGVKGELVVTALPRHSAQAVFVSECL